MRIENVEIVNVPVNSIIPYWRNPRRNDKTVEALCETIQKHGFNVPIVLDRNNVVVKGHARLRAAKRLGMSFVPCIYSDASEDVIKADRIADNKIQEMSSWEFGKLGVELEKFDMPVFDKLFNPADKPVMDDMQFGGMAFTPVTLQDAPEYGFDDFKGYEYGEEPKTEISGNYEPLRGGQEGSENQQEPVKRVLRCLCPYCGKLVEVNV